MSLLITLLGSLQSQPLNTTDSPTFATLNCTAVSASGAITCDTLTAASSVLGISFDTNVTAAGAVLSGTTLSADGTDANINIAITPKGTGVLQTGALGNAADTTAIAIAATGEITKPLNSAFRAYVSSTVSDQTGDNTVYTVVFDTEAYDKNADYDNSTGTFTAPVAGRYLFQVNILLDDLNNAVTHDMVRCRLVASIAGAQFVYLQKAAPDSNNEQIVNGCCIVELAASETVTCTVTVDGATKIVDVRGGAALTFWAGELIG